MTPASIPRDSYRSRASRQNFLAPSKSPIRSLTIAKGRSAFAISTISAAVAASHDGDVIAVQAGTYANDFATISTDITLHGVGGMANFVATVAPPNGKGILVTRAT